jgi:hypothetical protein
MQLVKREQWVRKKDAKGQWRYGQLFPAADNSDGDDHFGEQLPMIIWRNAAEDRHDPRFYRIHPKQEEEEICTVTKLEDTQPNGLFMKKAKFDKPMWHRKYNLWYRASDGVPVHLMPFPKEDEEWKYLLDTKGELIVTPKETEPDVGWVDIVRNGDDYDWSNVEEIDRPPDDDRPVPFHPAWVKSPQTNWEHSGDPHLRSAIYVPGSRLYKKDVEQHDSTLYNKWWGEVVRYYMDEEGAPTYEVDWKFDSQ